MESLLKSKLFKDGYISFNLKELDEEIYNNLENIFPIGNLKPEMFKNLMHSVRMDLNYEHSRQSLMNKKFEDLEIIKNDIITKFANKSDLAGSDCDQLWYYDWLFNVNTENNPFDKIIKPIFNKFYDNEITTSNSQVTMYNDGCYLNNHRDGNGEYSGTRCCVILIYLSTDYEKGKGGELVLSSDSGNELFVEPTYGNVAIMDFTKHDAYHRVQLVNGYDRYCFINFC